MSELRLELAFQAMDDAVCAQFRQHGSVEQRAILMTHSGFLDHPLNWQDEREKRRQLEALRVRILDVEPTRYALIGEAWVGSWNRGDIPLAPSKSEVRKECVYVFLYDSDGRSILGYREISIPPFLTNTVPVLGALRLEEGVSGPLAELLGQVV